MTEALAVVDQAVAITKDDIKRYICPEATDKEMFMFMGICKSFGLNPMKREVHLIKYGNNPAQIVTGYEVYLKRAERTGKVNGWSVEVAADGKSATVTIHRKDWAQPFVWTAYRAEFDKGQANWRTMPLFMLRKVAMAQAFRICFPDEMGGLPYLPEEISTGSSEALPGQIVDAIPEPVASPAAPAASVSSPPPEMGAADAAVAPVVEETESSVREDLESIVEQIAAITGHAYPAILQSLTENAAGKYGKKSVNDIMWSASKKGGGGEWSPLKVTLKRAKEMLAAEKAKIPSMQGKEEEQDITW